MAQEFVLFSLYPYVLDIILKWTTQITSLYPQEHRSSSYYGQVGLDRKAVQSGCKHTALSLKQRLHFR